MANAPLSPEELKLKQEKRDRIRRNLRILAIFVAGYYFVSAGMNWYEDYRADKTILVKEIRAFDGQDALLQILKRSVYGETLDPKLEVQGSYISVTEPELLKGVSAEIDTTSTEKEIASILYDTEISNGIPTDEQLKAARAYFSLCENNYSVEIINPLCAAMGFDKTNTAGEFKEGIYSSRKVQYSLTLSGPDRKHARLRAIKTAN